MAASDPKLELQIDPRVVRQLGAELITDPEQALLELIKNSYDADADRCRVEIDTEVTQELLSTNGKPEILVGSVSVQDDGPGTTLEDIKRKWLLISGSEKRPAEGSAKGLTKKNRAPLGDKGIGRLGTMRLGDRISFVSRKKGSSTDAKGVEFRWSQFNIVGTLGDVPVIEMIGKPSVGYSTLVKVEGLEEPEHWKGADQSELQARISKLISPFTDKHPLAVQIQIDGKPIELQKLRQDLNLHATAHYSFDFSRDAKGRDILDLTCSIANEFFGAKWIPSQTDRFFEEFTRLNPKFGLEKPTKGSSPRWIFRIKRKIDCGEIADFRSQESPGPFSGNIYSVSFSNDGGPGAVTAPSGAPRKLFQKLAGIMIYRDGFGVRIGPDWLELASNVTSGGSWYGLRINNTIGHIDITTLHNASLVEKSDREGFVDTPAWRQFFLIATKLRDEVNGIVEDLRRGHAGTLKRSGPAAVPTAEAAIKSLARDADFGRSVKRTLASQQEVLEKAISLAGELPSSKRTAAFTTQAQKILQDVKKQAREPVSSTSGESAQLLKTEIQNLRSQVRTAYDFIAAGMAAETLAHEVHPLLDLALQKIAAADRSARRVGLKDVSADLQGARAYLRLIGKQLSMLNPMLKVYRETKDTIDVAKFLSEYKDYVSSRMKEASIELDIVNRKPFHVQLPRGRLMQVVDNLVRNSEYWLQVPAAKRKVSSPQVKIEIGKPFLLISDNGLGIRPELEGRVFEMFVSDKPKDFGRGLGLFITREILMRYGCNISLADDTNSEGRRFRFVIDLSAVVG